MNYKINIILFVLATICYEVSESFSSRRPELVKRPVYKCNGKLRIACARAASECYEIVPPRQSDLVAEIMSYIGNLSRNRAHRSRHTTLHQMHNEEYYIRQAKRNTRRNRVSRHNFNQPTFRVKDSCRRCHELCWK